MHSPQRHPDTSWAHGERPLKVNEQLLHSHEIRRFQGHRSYSIEAWQGNLASCLVNTLPDKPLPSAWRYRCVSRDIRCPWPESKVRLLRTMVRLYVSAPESAPLCSNVACRASPRSGPQLRKSHPATPERRRAVSSASTSAPRRGYPHCVPSEFFELYGRMKMYHLYQSSIICIYIIYTFYQDYTRRNSILLYNSKL